MTNFMLVSLECESLRSSMNKKDEEILKLRKSIIPLIK